MTNLFGVRSQEERQDAARRDSEEKERATRTASSAMLFSALEALKPDHGLALIVTAIRDRKDYTPEQIERAANQLGREAHERARRINSG